MAQMLTIHPSIMFSSCHSHTLCDTQFHSITISDHAPTLNWRLNTSLLIDQDLNNNNNLKKIFNKVWTMSLQINNFPEIPICVIWEAAKTVMHGKN